MAACVIAVKADRMAATEGKLELMISKSTAFGRSCQPHSVGNCSYRIRMLKIDSKKVLWESVTKLMKLRYDEDNLTQLAKDVGFGPGTSTRLKEQETSVGVDLLDRIAHTFGFATWQLLVPGFDPKEPPALEGETEWPFPAVSAQKLRNLKPEMLSNLEDSLLVAAKIGNVDIMSPAAGQQSGGSK